MAGLVPAIRGFSGRVKGVDTRDKPGQDGSVFPQLGIRLMKLLKDDQNVFTLRESALTTEPAEGPILGEGAGPLAHGFSG